MQREVSRHPADITFLISAINEAAMKTAIISGANGNLGSAMVKQFIQDGYQVHGLVHRKAEQSVSDSRAYSEWVVDLRQETACADIVAQISAKGQIDAAILTAGGFAMGNIENTALQQVQQQITLNFDTAYNLARPVFLQMQKQGKGIIFLTGSRQGANPASGKESLAYTLSKSLIFRLSELLNAAAKGQDVVCAVVVPGTIDTPQNRSSMPEASFEDWAKPEDIAAVVAFYASDTAAIIREPVIKVYNKS